MNTTRTPFRPQPSAEQALTVRACAKLNLTLRVVGRRPDGFHEVESLMVAVNLFDELVVARHGGPDWQLSCDHPALPTGQRNLVTRALHELIRAASERRGASVEPGGLKATLRKRIPIGAGLGGGSSDAAAALLALNRLLGLGLSSGELCRCAARIGSDVPFFLRRRAAVARGRGERLERLDVHWPGFFLLVCPPLVCDTAKVYAGWAPAGLSEDRSVNPLDRNPQPSAAELGALLFNDLEAAAFGAYPQLAEWQRRVREVCGLPVRLTGSGSTLYCPLDTEQQAEESARAIRQRLGFITYVTRMLSESDATVRGALNEHQRNKSQAGPQ
jgi:4-diphosphocytidyl-2-C-methyl-D-erythritol kinase